jgi:hypothetical protein
MVNRTPSVSALGAQEAIEVTKSDVTVYSPLLDALYVGTGGTVVIKDAKGTTITFTNVPNGSILPVACSQVRSTSTTASGFVGLRY